MKKWFLVGLLLFQTTGLAQKDTVKVEKSPSKAVLYSLIPGGGQIYNKKYLKSIIIISAEAYSVYNYITNRNLYLDTDPVVDQVLRGRYRERRNKFAWWTGFVYIYGLLDAMVDSHLAEFEDDELDDLPLETGEDQSETEIIRN